jgi:hypothetical protein
MMMESECFLVCVVYLLERERGKGRTRGEKERVSDRDIGRQDGTGIIKLNQCEQERADEERGCLLLFLHFHFQSTLSLRFLN